MYGEDIAERRLDWKTLGPLAQQYQVLIAADVKANTRKLYGSDAFESGVASLQAFLGAPACRSVAVMRSVRL